MSTASVAHDSQDGPPDQAAVRRRAAKEHLTSLGLTTARWADRNGYSRKTVYKVMNGQLHGSYGVSHNIAVKLGLKDGDVDPEFEPVGMASNELAGASI